MILLPDLSLLASDLGIEPLLHWLRSWYWYAQPHLWFAPYTLLLIVELLAGRRVRAGWRDVSFNFAFLAVFITIFAAVSPSLKAVRSSVAAGLGGPYVDLRFGANDLLLPNAGALLVYLFVYDFFWYWWHRLQHTVPVLWVVHKLHHSDQNMGVTTTMKAHPVGELGRMALVTLPMALLFEFEPITIFWIAYSARLFEHFVHMNVNCHFGTLGFLIVSPNQHRVHHSTLPEHRNKNFATYFSVIDVVFGTYHPPERIAPPTGLDTGETYGSLWRAYMQPFTDWWQMGWHWAKAAAR